MIEAIGIMFEIKGWNFDWKSEILNFMGMKL